jgi:hypothetical protein
MNPERVCLERNPFRVDLKHEIDPRVLAALEPRAEISERPSALHERVAKAFDVNIH